jgi:hypothetical protein
VPRSEIDSEADGGQHLEQVEDDLKRSKFLESLGYKVIRFWNHEILGDVHIVLERIHGSLIEVPSPQPSPGGRGGKASGNPQILRKSRKNNDLLVLLAHRLTTDRQWHGS